MKNLENETLVFDNNVLSNFARIERLDLIIGLPCNLYTTREVFEELQDGIKAYSVSKPELASKLSRAVEIINQGKITIQSPNTLESFELYASIESLGHFGKGEISTMVLAKEIDAFFIADEKQAKKESAKHDIKILGKKEFKDTVIILQYLNSQGTISTADFQQIKNDLKNNSFLF